MNVKNGLKAVLYAVLVIIFVFSFVGAVSSFEKGQVIIGLGSAVAFFSFIFVVGSRLKE